MYFCGGLELIIFTPMLYILKEKMYKTVVVRLDMYLVGSLEVGKHLEGYIGKIVVMLCHDVQ